MIKCPLLHQQKTENFTATNILLGMSPKEFFHFTCNSEFFSHRFMLNVYNVMTQKFTIKLRISPLFQQFLYSLTLCT